MPTNITLDHTTTISQPLSPILYAAIIVAILVCVIATGAALITVFFLHRRHRNVRVEPMPPAEKPPQRHQSVSLGTTTIAAYRSLLNDPAVESVPSWADAKTLSSYETAQVTDSVLDSELPSNLTVTATTTHMRLAVPKHASSSPRRTGAPDFTPVRWLHPDDVGPSPPSYTPNKHTLPFVGATPPSRGRNPQAYPQNVHDVSDSMDTTDTWTCDPQPIRRQRVLERDHYNTQQSSEDTQQSSEDTQQSSDSTQQSSDNTSSAS